MQGKINKRTQERRTQFDLYIIISGMKYEIRLTRLSAIVQLVIPEVYQQALLVDLHHVQSYCQS